MDDLTPLIRPAQSQVKIDSVAKECPSDGFNYPTFRQLNKHARVYLSTPFNLDTTISYNLFDVANSKGWFVAVKQAASGSELVLSTLEDLRASFSTAKDSPSDLFSPKRTVSTPSRVNIVRFAGGDSRLLVAQDNGSILVFDTSQLFTETRGEVYPVTSTHIQSTYLHQILPNPGTEPGLNDLVAVVSNGKVQLFNTNLEPQGGWVASDLMSQPIAVSWSPKGKHLAIGLQTGDILTFSLTNKSTPHKHIPPTVDGILSSVNWLGPGHTFRTSYAAQNGSSPQQHVIVLDAKSSAAIYYAPDYPFPCSDRNYQNAYVVAFAKWDADSASNDEGKSLTVVGDACSIDLEIIGNAGNSWYRQSQENPLSLPLDASMDDTILVGFETDLTDSAAAAPIMYAYLNDGSLQGWHLEHSKPYLGIVSPGGTTSTSTAQGAVNTQNPAKDADMGAEGTNSSNAFGQTSTATNAFSQTSSSFAQQSSSAFGSNTTNAFGAFGQKAPAFGQSSFGQPSAFGTATGFTSTSPFAQPSQTNSSTSSFGSATPAAGFGAFGGSSNAFGSSPFSSNTTTNAFSGLNSGSTNAFGQGSFGSSNQSSTTTTDSSANMTREASMSDSTPGFGGLGLGSATPTDPNARNSMFGSFSSNVATDTNTQSGGFGSGGSLLKPATGFGAFGSSKGGSAFEAKTLPPVSAFGSTTQPTTTTASGFGQSGFANPAFGKPAFGQSAFGQPAFGQPAFGKPSLGAASTTTTSAPISGGFGAFANATTGFGSAAQQQKPASTAPSSGGFGAFASSTPSAFGATSAANTTESKQAAGTSAFGATAEQKPASTGNAFSAFNTVPLAFGSSASTSTTPKETPGASPFGSSASGSASPFAAAATAASPFGSSTTPAKPSPFGNTRGDSPPSSPEPGDSPPVKPAASVFAGGSTTPSSTPNAFSNIQSTSSAAPNAFSNLQSTPSAFKPATGFGAFGSFGGSNTSSPFYKKPDETPQVTAFALSATPKTPTTPTTPATSTTTTPAFGSASALGGPKSVFAPVSSPTTTPTKPPATGGFSAFSGASSNFSSYVSNKTSFADLLKAGGDDAKDPEKSPTRPGSTPTASTSVFAPPKPTPLSAFAPINQQSDSSKKPLSDEPSYGSISASSASSSYVDVSREEEGDDDEGDAEHSGEEEEDSFLSDDANDTPAEHSDEEHDVSDRDDLPDDDEEERSPSPEPAPRSPSRSPSATPQPETPSIKVSSPAEDDEEESEEPVEFEREASGTPPGTPTKKSASPPPATPAGPSSSAFGLGLGRPSTRPTRSSPLSNAISHDEDEDEDEEAEEGETTEQFALPSPKSPVEILPVKLDDDNSVKRPKTPPLLFSMGGKSPRPSSAPLPPAESPASKSPSLFTAPPLNAAKSDPLPTVGGGGLSALASAAASSPSIFSKPIEKTTPAASPPAASMPQFFGATPTFPPVVVPPSVFGKSPFSSPSPSPVAQPTPGIKSPTLLPVMGQTPSQPSAPASFSLFGAAKGMKSTFGGPPVATPSTPPAKGFFPTTAANPTTPPNVPTPTKVSPRKEEPPLEGLQKECAMVMERVDGELYKTKQAQAYAHELRAKHMVSSGNGHVKADLGNSTKWGLMDVEHFGRILLQCEADLDELESQKDKNRQALREIQSSMLKAGTRKEEIIRFNKAKDDKEFAKMLRSRTLGPEHSETQTQLRKTVRAVRDRIQKLELHLQEDKKKLAQATSLKPSFRAPSLDTINRTYRNIEIAIEQQSDMVARLASRIAKLDIEEVKPPSILRDGHLKVTDGLRSFNVTPNVAATTAAALNAERSARRLKNALLKVRSQPLLNEKAVPVTSAPTGDEKYTPPSPKSLPGELPEPPTWQFQTPSGGPFDAAAFNESFDAPDWEPSGSTHSAGGSPGRFNPMGSPSGSRKKGLAARYIPPVSAQKPPVPEGFEWGPLPTFNTPKPPLSK